MLNTEFRLQLVRFFNFYPVKEQLMRWQYHPFKKSVGARPMLISTVDEKRKSQGMADRFKGIISVYALSKAQNTAFRIVYTTPFSLEEFLRPNDYNWIPKSEEIADSFFSTEYCILRKYPSIKRLLNKLPSKKQVRIYANLNYLEEINSIYKTNYSWGTLFLELFKPTEQLQHKIDFHLKQIGENYIACVFRFQNLLGDFPEYNAKPLAEKQRGKLIETNKQALQELLQKYRNEKILVTSDSAGFLKAVSALENVYIIPGKLVHIDCNSGEENEVYLKSFLDFYLIAHAKKVYSIGTPNMYPTEFPVYAAKVFNRPFERLKIKEVV